MVTNSFGNRNFMQPMGRLSMHVLFGWMTGRMDKGRMTKRTKLREASFFLYYILVCVPCIMHRWNKNPTLSQNHNLPTYLPTHLRIKFPTSQALVPTFSFSAFSLLTLHTFSLFLSKTTPYLPTYLRACLPPSLVLFPTSLAWLREKAKSR
jgi:hypothetical protein